jgi:hypothetical protein
MLGQAARAELADEHLRDRTARLLTAEVALEHRGHVADPRHLDRRPVAEDDDGAG